MPEKIKRIKRPRGLARWGFRLPIGLYQIGLGSLLGTRFLLLTHTGRRSGQERRTVLEVVRHSREKDTFVVAAGFGPGSDWYRNILIQPQVIVQCGRRRWNMTAQFLAPSQSGQELVDYARRHPLAMRELARFMGYRLDGTEADVRALGRILSMVSFQPAPGKEKGLNR